MAALNRRFGEVVTHEALIRQVFAGTDEVTDAQAQIGTVMVHLRRKLRPAGLVIRLQRGVGYALEHAPGRGGLTPSTSRFSRRSASIFSRCDLPDPKKPEIHTPLAVL